MKKRQLTTLRNTSIMAKLNENGGVELIPVIHASHILSAKWFLSKLNEIGEFNVYGIGSLVPTTRRMKGYVLTVEKAVRIIHFLRQELPDKKIHAFGVGGSRLMHLIFYAGANWVDSMSWFIEAINGWVEVLFEDGMVKTKRLREINRDDLQALDNCQCPVCRYHSPEDLDRERSLRVVHNAWIRQKLVERVRELIEEGAVRTMGKATFLPPIAVTLPLLLFFIISAGEPRLKDTVIYSK